MPYLLTNFNSAFTFTFRRARQIEAFSAKMSTSLGTASSTSRIAASGDKNGAISCGVYFGDKGGRNNGKATFRIAGTCSCSTRIAASGEEKGMYSCGNVSSVAKASGVYFGNKGGRNGKGILRMNAGVRFPVESMRMSWNCNPVIRVGANGGCGHWLIRCYADGAASEVSVDSSLSVDLDQISTVAVPAEKETFSSTPLKLVSGSCYLPHPDKEKTGGEDAHFICTEEQVIGVADGVGGWADMGIDAGYYARELMSNSVSAIKDEPKRLIDPARVLEKAHKCTTSKGSSTACIVALTEQGLHAINLGDSGFIVVREGRTVFESPAQQHSFNFTFQLENGKNSDLPGSGQVFTIPVEIGDVIVAGTDGLFDNLYNNEISSTVATAVSAGLSPDSTAQKIAALARQRALDRKRQTPFSAAAQEAGYHYYGGKLDDITVVVAYISG